MFKYLISTEKMLRPWSPQARQLTPGGKQSRIQGIGVVVFTCTRGIYRYICRYIALLA